MRPGGPVYCAVYEPLSHCSRATKSLFLLQASMPGSQVFATDAGCLSPVTHKQPAPDPLFLEPKDHNKETTGRHTLYVSCTPSISCSDGFG